MILLVQTGQQALSKCSVFVRGDYHHCMNALCISCVAENNFSFTPALPLRCSAWHQNTHVWKNNRNSSVKLLLQSSSSVLSIWRMCVLDLEHHWLWVRLFYKMKAKLTEQMWMRCPSVCYSCLTLRSIDFKRVQAYLPPDNSQTHVHTVYLYCFHLQETVRLP